MKIIVCTPLGTPAYEPQPDSEENFCDNCNCDVWIGPKQRELLATEANCCVACTVCAGELFPEFRTGFLAIGERYLLSPN